jgi:hypothetical protein
MGDERRSGRAGQQEAGHAGPGQDAAAAASSHSVPSGVLFYGVKEAKGERSMTRKTLDQAKGGKHSTRNTACAVSVEM